MLTRKKSFAALMSSYCYQFSFTNDTFMIGAYFRNSQKVEGVCQFFVQDTWNEIREQSPNNLVDYAHFSNVLKHYVTQFRKSGSLEKNSRKH